MPQKLKRVWNVVTTVFVVLVVAIAVLLVGVRLFGIKPYTVLSGSMEPKYPVGSMIYVVEVDPLTLKEGDPVTFMLNETTVATHRIIEVIPDEEDPTVVRFRTKGDNNDIPDGDPLHSKNVIGKPLFAIPLLGYVANYVQNPPGRYVALGVCVIMLIACMIPAGDKKGKQPNDLNKERPLESEASAPAEGEGEEPRQALKQEQPVKGNASEPAGGDKPEDNVGVTPQGSQINDPKTNSEEKEDN